jgi:peroxiredoxin Q/BCP
MKLEYLTIYKSDGTPFYSHCFGGFCSQLAIDNDLLQGFVSALSFFPEQLNQRDESSYTVEMGKFKLLFNKNLHKEILICLGVAKSVKKSQEKYFLDLFDFIDKFWINFDSRYTLESGTNYQEFEENFYHEVLLPWSIKTGFESVSSEHEHPAGEICPLKTSEQSIKSRTSLWDKITSNFNNRSKLIKKINTKFGKLKVGMRAPEFHAESEKGEKISLSNYLGNYVVLYFYPQAKTPGCVKEAEGFRDVYDNLTSMNAHVIGVSTDPGEQLVSFKEDTNIPYDLITDYSKNLANLYSGIGLLQKANRITYLIDPEGIIIKIWKLTGLFAQMNLYHHAQDVMESLSKEIEIVNL